MQIANRFLRQSRKKENRHLNPLDVQYGMLRCALTPLDHTSPEHMILVEAIETTHGPTHSRYLLEVARVFAVNRARERARFASFSRLHNRQLLWHGSRLTNFAGILSKGLRIAPPEAPSTGYMFGKGLYFADVASKAANYIHASAADPYGLLLCCDVALGDCYPLQEAEYMSEAPAPYHSTCGQGKHQPSRQQTLAQDGGNDNNAKLNLGPLDKPAERGASKLLYNEYIVFDEAQVRIDFMLLVKFNFL
eukprot:g78302.t1